MSNSGINKYRIHFNRLGFCFLAGLLLQGCTVTKDDGRFFEFVKNVRTVYPQGEVQIKTLFPVPFASYENRRRGEYSLRSFRIGNVIIGRTYIWNGSDYPLPERVSMDINGICINKATVLRYFPDLKWDYKLTPGPHNMNPDIYYVSRADKNGIRLRVSYPIYNTDTELEEGCLNGVELSSVEEKYEWD